jgi:lipopolysaccharide transport system ATP-binding protein
LSIVLTAKHLSLDYAVRQSYLKSTTKRVLDNVSFEVHEGECLGIIGRNGVGKTSLLKVLAGILKPNGGEVVTSVKSITLLTLGAGFDPDLSGTFNVILNGMLMGYSKSEMLEKIPGIKEFSDLGPVFDQPLKTYSTGMRARLAFSTALQLEPDVLLIDEVLAVGDAEFSQKSLAAMREKLSSHQTAVLVSHQAFVITSVCDRAVWIEDGVTKMIGPSEDVVPAYEDFLFKNK